MVIKIKDITIASICLALAIIIPQTFHVFQSLGSILLPMHIPVLICGFACGPFLGCVVGFISPFISNVLFSMPSSTMLIQMMAELSVYGLLTGLFRNKNVYLSLVVSMIVGRVINGIMNILLIDSYSLAMWLSISFVKAIPGIIIQLIIVPIIVKSIKHLE